jgi:uncharacterized protein YndB with AHSA1/START domain
MTEPIAQPDQPDQPADQPDYRPSPLAAVYLSTEPERWTLLFTRILSHPVNRVWELLTEPGQLRHWAPYVPDRDLATTGPAELTMQDGSAAVLDGAVLQADPPQLLVHLWGQDQLRWELTGTDDGTTLTLRQRFATESMAAGLAAGWHICLDVADALMKDVPFGPVVGERAHAFGWDELNQQYAEALGVKPTVL